MGVVPVVALADAATGLARRRRIPAETGCVRKWQNRGQTTVLLAGWRKPRSVPNAVLLQAPWQVRSIGNEETQGMTFANGKHARNKQAWKLREIEAVFAMKQKEQNE